MSKILVLNCGSSSIKYEVYQLPESKSLGKGLVERIGLEEGIITQSFDSKKIEKRVPIPNHTEGIKMVLDLMTSKEDGFLSSVDEITGVGHRVVHGGEKYTKSILITPEVEEEIEKCYSLAPLHNPANLIGIRAIKAVLPNVDQVAVFDTSFHQTMPKKAYLYGVNLDLYKRHRIRRYGFHGTSHKYVFNKSCEYLGKTPTKTNAIILHLGNGASLCAIKDGESVDTSMGLTPLAGVIMGTRSGDIDPGIILNLVKVWNYPIEEVDKMLNKESGMQGLSGVSSDMRDIHKAISEGNERAKDALETYVYNIRRFLGSYLATLGRVDFIAFTGGVGENDNVTRELICHNLENLGIKMDYNFNSSAPRGKENVLSTKDSETAILLMPTNEELQIATDTIENIKK